MGTMFNICLRYFEIANDLREDRLTDNDFSFLEPGSFGYDPSLSALISYLRETVVFEDGKPTIVISSSPRISVEK